jgi:hypothetical protein
MHSPLVDEDPKIRVNRVGKQTRKGKDSQRESLPQLRQFRGHQQTDFSTISRISDEKFVDLPGSALASSKIFSISELYFA